VVPADNELSTPVGHSRARYGASRLELSTGGGCRK